MRGYSTVRGFKNSAKLPSPVPNHGAIAKVAVSEPAETEAFKPYLVAAAPDCKTGALAETDPPGVGTSPRRPGRPKGSPNKVSRDARDLLAKHGPDAIKMLCKLAAGQAIYRGTGDDKRRLEPTLDQSIAAAKVVVDRLVPTLKAVEMTGNGDAGGLLGTIELCRRIAFIMQNGPDRTIL